MKLESPKKVIDKTPETIYGFLINVGNYEQLMPENISKFEVLGDKKFVFALKGMPEIVLEIKESTPFNKIVLGSVSDKMPFSLLINILELTEKSSEVQLYFEGEFNSMVSMMIKSPIKKFMETLVNNLQHI